MGVHETGLKIIQFTSLPSNLRTQVVRIKYDTDGSGFLESRNSKGENEISKIEQEMGLELSTYKQPVSKVIVENDKENSAFKESTLYDNNGKPATRLRGIENFYTALEYTEINENVETIYPLDDNFNKYSEYKTTRTKNTTYNGTKGWIKEEHKVNSSGDTRIKYENDNTIISMLLNSNNDTIAFNKFSKMDNGLLRLEKQK